MPDTKNTEPNATASNNPEQNNEADGHDTQAELKAAFSHLKTAAKLFAKRATEDAAHLQKEAEKAVAEFGHQAEPVAQKIATQLSNLTQSLVSALDSNKKKGPGDSTPPEKP